MADTQALDPGTREANAARRRRMAIIALVAVAALFIVQLLALAVGLPELSFAIFALIIAGWFVLRSYQKRYPI
jgi:positive regulator of sigma E activity